MLGIFSVWLWSLIVNSFIDISESLSLNLIPTFSYYVLWGTMISFLALKKIKSKKIIDGLRIGVVTLLSTILYILVSVDAYSGLIIVLLISFPLGGYFGGVLLRRL